MQRGRGRTGCLAHATFPGEHNDTAAVTPVSANPTVGINHPALLRTSTELYRLRFQNHPHSTPITGQLKSRACRWRRIMVPSRLRLNYTANSDTRSSSRWACRPRAGRRAPHTREKAGGLATVHSPLPSLAANSWTSMHRPTHSPDVRLLPGTQCESRWSTCGREGRTPAPIRAEFDQTYD